MSVSSVFFEQVFTRKLFAFAGNSLLVYDYLLTLSLEIAYVWNEPWSLVKSLFLINRYGNLIGQTFIMLEETGYLSHGSRQFCVGFQIFCTFFSVISGESIRLFVVMRACAIVGCRRRIALLINGLYALYGLGMLMMSFFLFSLHLDVVSFELLDEVGICILPAPPDGWAYWFIPLLLDGCVLAVVCRSLYESIKGTSNVSPSPLICLLARDGLVFYIAALFNVAFSMVCWTVFSEDPRYFLQTLITYPFLSVIGQRLVLNLRKFRARPDSTRDVSEEVNRQIAAMADVDVELDQLGMVADLHLDHDVDSDWRSQGSPAQWAEHVHC